MDRAERRQRRLEQKVQPGGRRGRGRGRGRMLQQGSEASNCDPTDQPERFKCSCGGLGEGSTPRFRPGPAGPSTLCNACGLPKGNSGDHRIVSEEEGSDDVTVYEGEKKLSLEGLQAQLHLSDAKVSKWHKLASKRLDENKELQMEIQCLKLKIKEITEAKAARCGQVESRLKAEIQSLKGRNDELIKILDSWVHNWVKRHSSDTENLMQILQNAKSNKQNTHYQTSQGTGNPGRHVHEPIAEVNVCNGDQNNAHREPSKQTANFERNGCESAAEVIADAEQRNSGYPDRQTQNLGGNGSKIAQQMNVDASPPKRAEKYVNSERRVSDSNADMTIDIGGQSSDYAEGKPNGLHRAPTIGNEWPDEVPSEDESAVLFTAAQKKAALAFVNKEFLTWLNSRTRRPTPEEMSSHKSHFMRKSWPPGEETFYWTGIPGSLLLDRFQVDTEIEKPSNSTLTTVLRSVLNIAGSTRAHDSLWCLVWADCINPAQLPGYTRNLHGTKRARAADYEVAMKSAERRHS
ncbi:unnamed protein product [Calypogeia fissa]